MFAARNDIARPPEHVSSKALTRTLRVRQKRNDLQAKLDSLSRELVTSVLEAARRTARPREEPSSHARKVAHRIRRLRALQRAVEWQLELETGAVGSRTELAKREGISLPAVTQAMRVLNVFEDGRGDLLPTQVFRTRRKTGAPKVGPFRKLRNELLRNFETEYVTATLRAAGGNISMAARLAQIERKHFWRLLHRSDAKEGLGPRLPRKEHTRPVLPSRAVLAKT
jgi:DNA-binding NtrC family response regulator